MLRTSVCFDYYGNCVEYGLERNAAGELDTARPFVEVNGHALALTEELLAGWIRRDFGTAVHAYMQRYYPAPKPEPERMKRAESREEERRQSGRSTGVKQEG